MHLSLRARAPLAIVFLAALGLSSCGDDPELVKKREEQRAEIRRLEGELTLLRDQLDNAPKDRSAELAELQKNTETEKTKIAQLESEITSLGAEKEKLEKELETYKREYPLR